MKRGNPVRAIVLLVVLAKVRVMKLCQKFTLLVGATVCGLTAQNVEAQWATEVTHICEDYEEFAGSTGGFSWFVRDSRTGKAQRQTHCTPFATPTCAVFEETRRVGQRKAQPGELDEYPPEKGADCFVQVCCEPSDNAAPSFGLPGDPVPSTNAMSR